jgi:rhomboid protease GluP
VQAAYAVDAGLATPWQALVGPRPDRMILAVGGRYAPWMTTEPWRLLSSLFVHIDVGHLGVNALAAAGLSRAGARRVPGWGWALTFLLAGVAGGRLADAMGVVRSAGASGGLHGWLALLVVEPHLRRPVLASAVGSLALSLVVPAIDLGAHAGGLAVGVIAAALSVGVGRDGARPDDGACADVEAG